MIIKSKFIKFLECPNVLFAKFAGIHPLYAYYLSKIKKITSKDFKTVIDVGANIGNYSKAAHYYYPHAKIYSFEPVQRGFDIINRFPYVQAFSFALWDKNDKAKINIPNKKDLDDGSSFLKPGKESFVDRENKIYGYDNIEVERKRFDNLNIDIKKPCLLKLDTEGSEMFVLKGFGNRLKEIDVIQLEANFESNYEGQANVGDLINYLRVYGFEAFIQILFRNEKENYPNHCDLMFIRK